MPLKNKDALKAYQSWWRKNNRDYRKKWRQNNPEYDKEYNKLNRTKVSARTTTNYQIRLGTISRLKCEKCDCLKTEAHHDDYTKPLEVRWFCKQHHEDLHHI